jgi:aminoglycoside 6'-N-acetyltransferase I
MGGDGVGRKRELGGLSLGNLSKKRRSAWETMATKKSGFQVRPARRSDLAEWARMRHALWPTCPPPQTRIEMGELFGNRRKFGVLVIDRGDGRLGGFAELALRDGVDGAAREVTAFLEGWYVDEDLRGRGWGRKLIVAAGAWAKARGMIELASDAELGNVDSVAAHGALGFRETFRVVQFIKRVRRAPG